MANLGPAVTQSENTQANMEPTGPNYLGGIVEPPALPSGNTDNWTVLGFQGAGIVKVVPNAANSTLTGLVGGTPNRLIWLINHGGGGNLVLKNLDAGSNPVNQFTTPGATDLTIAQYSAVQLWYDPEDSQWHALAWS